MCTAIREAALHRYGWNDRHLKSYCECRTTEGECLQRQHPDNGQNRTTRDRSAWGCPECVNGYDTLVDTWKSFPTIRAPRLQLSYHCVHRPPAARQWIQKVWKARRPGRSLWRRYQSSRRNLILRNPHLVLVNDFFSPLLETRSRTEVAIF